MTFDRLAGGGSEFMKVVDAARRGDNLPGTMMEFSESFDGFKLAYWRTGSGSPVVLLHGWPGDHTDWDHVVAALGTTVDVVVPDRRGFGLSDKHDVDAERYYSGLGQARAVAALLDQLNITKAVFGGYDVGSFVAQSVAAVRPDLVKALVISPPLPGGGERVLELTSVREFWYTSFHQLDLARQIVDGRRDAVRAYLHHFWSHWSGPDYVLDEGRIDHLADVYSPKGAFIVAAQWYRSSSNPVTAYAAETVPSPDDRLKTPASVLWQACDPIFPEGWSDRLDDFFSDYILESLPRTGHFTPLEATEIFARAILHRTEGPE
jgi:pimeloyl-ACP methyl ester carboxylesterase